jgi:hypothetical protein
MAERVLRFRIADVAASEATPIGRIEAMDAEGRRLSVELPTAWLRGVRSDDDIVLKISIDSRDTQEMSR